ncbi:MAG: putative nucleic acid-binding Zn ribbon protein [Lentimonas sp.]|jgi:predicted nucleic acid-binding Zn ribbon protein
METIQEKMKVKRSCEECGDKLLGRKDQKFCSDYCRNTFNNRLNEDATTYVRRVNNILRKNRRILAQLNPKGKLTVDTLTLAESGFNFHYFTNLYKTQKGSSYYFCYDQGYIKVDDNNYMLVVKQDYVR